MKSQTNLLSNKHCFKTYTKNCFRVKSQTNLRSNKHCFKTCTKNCFRVKSQTNLLSNKHYFKTYTKNCFRVKSQTNLRSNKHCFKTCTKNCFRVKSLTNRSQTITIFKHKSAVDGTLNKTRPTNSALQCISRPSDVLCIAVPYGQTLHCINNNNAHLSCAHQRPERSHDTY